ncbi:hypothetical protein Droror1_Dr00026885 [Drosera rotundifolia]
MAVVCGWATGGGGGGGSKGSIRRRRDCGFRVVTDWEEGVVEPRGFKLSRDEDAAGNLEGRGGGRRRRRSSSDGNERRGCGGGGGGGRGEPVE